MADGTQTPHPTALSRSQVFELKTTRPANNDASGPLSPVPNELSLSKPIVKRVYAGRRSIRTSASSKDLKENFPAPGRLSGGGFKAGGINLKNKLRARRTTSFASLKGRRTESSHGDVRTLARNGSRVSLASPFCSRPSSPELGDGALARQSPTGSKRTQGNEPDRRSSKRQNSTVLEPGPLLDPLLHRSTSLHHASEKNDTELRKRPSHPSFGGEASTGRPDDRRFGPVDVDFNRPPSQQDVYDPLHGEHGYGSYLSADEWVYDHNFESEILGASTPYNRKLHTSNPSVSAKQRPASERFAVPDITKTVLQDHQTESPENMSLTSIKEGSLHLAHDSTAPLSPWITDSLISPPTIYRNAAKADPHSRSQPSVAQSNGSGDVVLSSESNLGLKVPGLGSGPESTNVDAIHQGKGSSTGYTTLLAPAPVIATKMITSRTRTGTIVAAPSFIPKPSRARSGTITPNSALYPVPIANAANAGRTRSGTVTALPRPSNPLATSDKPNAPSALEPAFGEDENIPAHIDSLFDPTPHDALEFSSAPNPDIDGESDDENLPNSGGDIALSNAPASVKPSRKLKLGILPSQTELASKDSASDKAPQFQADGSKKAVGKGMRPRSAGKASTVDGSSAGTQLKRLNIKAALGFSGKSSEAEAKSSKPSESTGVVDNPDADDDAAVADLVEKWGSSILSSDPLDVLSQFDEKDFNEPYKAPANQKKKRAPTKGKGASSRAR